jgi:hypothetical protein
MNDTTLSKNVMKCLLENFGAVQTERFISIIIKEPFDYTKWQTDLYKDMTVDELFEAASKWKESNAEGL